MPVINKYHHGGQVPAGAINIMRGSSFGNPFVIGQDGTREEVIEKFRVWLWDKLKKDPVFADQVRGLHGRDLCCVCAPQACHGDVLMAAAKWLAENKAAGAVQQ